MVAYRVGEGMHIPGGLGSLGIAVDTNSREVMAEALAGKMADVAWKQTSGRSQRRRYGARHIASMRAGSRAPKQVMIAGAAARRAFVVVAPPQASCGSTRFRASRGAVSCLQGMEAGHR